LFSLTCSESFVKCLESAKEKIIGTNLVEFLLVAERPDFQFEQSLTNGFIMLVQMVSKTVHERRRGLEAELRIVMKENVGHRISMSSVYHIYRVFHE
jgi:hypothetical protein